MQEKPKKRDGTVATPAAKPQNPPEKAAPVPEVGGRPGPEPTRYGDWENNGRCVDF